MTEVIETLKDTKRMNILCWQDLESPRVQSDGLLANTAS
jgi:hypothetical protein